MPRIQFCRKRGGKPCLYSTGAINRLRAERMKPANQHLRRSVVKRNRRLPRPGNRLGFQRVLTWSYHRSLGLNLSGTLWGRVGDNAGTASFLGPCAFSRPDRLRSAQRDQFGVGGSMWSMTTTGSDSFFAMNLKPACCAAWMSATPTSSEVTGPCVSPRCGG